MTGAESSRAAAAFVSPAAIVSLAIAAVPLLFILYTSLGGAALSLEAFENLLTSTLFKRSLYTTLEISVSASLISLLLGYVVALHLARQPPRRRAVYMVLVLLPFWTSILVKSYAFTVILGREGVINLVLSWVFGTQVALPMILNRFGVMVGMTNYLTPFIVFPVLASLLAIDPALYRAADIMSARPMRIFFTITLPLSLPGIVAGVSSVMVMSLGFFVIPALLGGRQDVMLANLVDFYTRETLDWNMAAAIGVLLLAMVVLLSAPALWMRRNQLAGKA
ncbi:putative spermidine/putrescine transport system permease protein/mannopine transport system permease protein [Bosea sp. BE125]|uniref:ABC transporter permease n=1 Tax=Bosea sp. BE125 TaxID=2817909 RepID=UPI00285ECE1F|nr:ABC transporter permease [Bosea sp. BE125]MDR6869379.1 putative spermidine/putrescine transport system permease protein/mannopine transport system permease protein [Bosea sp. BE125]